MVFFLKFLYYKLSDVVALWQDNLVSALNMNNDKESTRKATGFRGTSQSQPITPRRKEYMRREISNTSRAVQTHTVASGDSIRNAPDELF